VVTVGIVNKQGDGLYVVDLYRVVSRIVAGERKYDIFELGLDLIGFTNASIVKDVTLADNNLVYLKSGRPEQVPICSFNQFFDKEAGLCRDCQGNASGTLGFQATECTTCGHMWKARQDLLASNPDDPSLKFADPSTVLCQNPEAVWNQIEAARN